MNQSHTFFHEWNAISEKMDQSFKEISCLCSAIGKNMPKSRIIFYSYTMKHNIEEEQIIFGWEMAFNSIYEII